MKFLFLVFWAGFLHAADLTGRWTGPASTADNGQELVVALKQSPNGSYSGYIIGPRATDTIVSGKLEGANLTLDVERAGRGNNAAQKLTYAGIVEGNKLKLTLP